MSANDVKSAVGSAVETALARLRSDLVESIVKALPEPEPPAPPAPAPAAGAVSGLAADGLKSAVFSIMDGSGQVDILNRLMESIGTYWERSVLFLVKQSFQPWDARGFENGIG